MIWKVLSVLLPLAMTHMVASRVMPPRPSVPEIAAPEVPVTDQNGTTLPPLTQIYFFDQLIDHNNPKLGTFQQRFWHTWEFYKSGGPIILMTPGETNAQGFTGYLTNRTVNGQIAQQENGATIVLEHRFFGHSNPKPDLSVQSLQLLNIQQAVDDLEYFAKNVKLPMPGGDNVKPDTTPWILIGGSYSGALTSWTMVNKPDLFAAGYASSAVVEAIVDYWAYFEPIRQFMPKNCSADVEAVIAHFDQLFTSGNLKAINDMKASFGLANLSHIDDFASTLRFNLFDWQSLSPDSGPGQDFFKFCDALEVKDGVSAPASGWGLDHALQAWATFFSGDYLADLCDGEDSIEDCLGTHDKNQDFYTNVTLNNSNRSWFWFVCNEVGWLQDSPPPGHPALVSRALQISYDEAQCAFMFPQQFRRPPQINVARTNAKFQGWDVQQKNLFFANGQRDPWREATLSADGQHFRSTPSQPIALSDGFHCSDLITLNGNQDPTVKAVQQQALVSMHQWLIDWNASQNNHHHHHRSFLESLSDKWSRAIGALGA